MEQSTGTTVQAGGAIARLWENICAHWKFKFVLPRTEEVTLHGVRLDVRELSLVMRNKLLLERYEVQEFRMAQQHLAASDSVLEIGGAIGFLGIYCQKHLGISQFATVEANPQTAGMLRRNYALNGLEPLLFNAALADHDGEVDLDVGGEFWGNSILPSGPPSADKTRVPAISFETLLKRLCFPVSALIVDIEGAEKFIDWNKLPVTVGKIIMEIHPQVIGVAEQYRIVANLINQGFKVESEDCGTFFFKKNLA